MQKNKIIDADVIICGCGAAGLSAALMAKYGGADVVIFEKRAVAGGTTVFTEGLFAVESSMQARKNIAITKDEAFRSHMDYSHWRANARLVRAFMNKSGDSIDWLQDQGVEFYGPIAIYPGAPHVWHMTVGGGNALVEALVAKAKNMEIPIYLKTAVKRLVQDENRQITGIIAEDENRQVIEAKANAVILSAGDFANNKEMLEEYTKLKEAITFGNMGMTGDAIRMAWDVGAAPEGAQVVLGGSGVEGEVGPNSHLWPAACQPLLWVNQMGERYCSEDIMYHFPFAMNAQLRQPNGKMFVVFDESTKESLIEEGTMFGLGEVFPPTTKLDRLEDDLNRGLKEGKVFMADTPEALAQSFGADGRVLKETVDEYNRCCDGRYDHVFAKNPKYLLPVRDPKFYAIRCGVFLMSTVGGIKVNHRTEVLNKQNGVIRGLYAAGNCAGGIYGDSYDVTNSTGGALSFAVNSGRIAGESALAYIGK
jgi:fumarate reductase flavoprotein subunit